MPKLGQIREIYISKETEGHAGDGNGVSVCSCKHEHLLLCMPTNFWHAWPYILAKFGPIRKIKVSIE